MTTDKISELREMARGIIIACGYGGMFNVIADFAKAVLAETEESQAQNVRKGGPCNEWVEFRPSGSPQQNISRLGAYNAWVERMNSPVEEKPAEASRPEPRKVSAWAVVDSKGNFSVEMRKQGAEQKAAKWDTLFPAAAPHVVVFLSGTEEPSPAGEEPAEPREFWVNEYRNAPAATAYRSREIADEWAAPDRSACIRVREVMEGK